MSHRHHDPNHEGHRYELEIRDVLIINETDYLKSNNLKSHRYRNSKTAYAISGNILVATDLNEDWDISMDCWRSKLGNNQWELTAFKASRQSTCIFIKNIYKEHLQPDLQESSDLPIFDEDTNCPFPKGLYTITNYVTDVRNYPNYMQDGTYKIEIFLWKNDENMIVAGLQIIVKISAEY